MDRSGRFLSEAKERHVYQGKSTSKPEVDFTYMDDILDNILILADNNKTIIGEEGRRVLKNAIRIREIARQISAEKKESDDAVREYMDHQMERVKDENGETIDTKIVTKVIRFYDLTVKLLDAEKTFGEASITIKKNLIRSESLKIKEYKKRLFEHFADNIELIKQLDEFTIALEEEVEERVGKEMEGSITTKLKNPKKIRKLKEGISEIGSKIWGWITGLFNDFSNWVDSWGDTFEKNSDEIEILINELEDEYENIIYESANGVYSEENEENLIMENNNKMLFEAPSDVALRIIEKNSSIDEETEKTILEAARYLSSNRITEEELMDYLEDPSDNGLFEEFSIATGVIMYQDLFDEVCENTIRDLIEF